MRDTLVDKVVDKLLNDKNMTPAKIKSFSYVIQALSGVKAVEQEPNEVKAEKNEQELLEDKPIDFAEIQGIQIDGMPREKVKIFKNPSVQ